MYVYMIHGWIIVDLWMNKDGWMGAFMHGFMIMDSWMYDNG